MMPMFYMLGGFNGEESLVHDGAVGAHLIQGQMSVVVVVMVVLSNLPSVVDLV
jgi:hypothetical protein